jgi:hypothetical protein
VEYFKRSLPLHFGSDYVSIIQCITAIPGTFWLPFVYSFWWFYVYY